MSGSSTTTLSVLTLNCWGLKLVSKNRNRRIEAIADSLARSDYEIVCLQEVWVYANYELIRNRTKKRFPHSKFTHSGVIGGGIVILSRYPIVEFNFHKYRLNGRPIKITHGDWYSGKGLTSAVVDHPVSGLIEVFNTHLHASYEPKKNDEYLAHRVSQAWEIANLMKTSASRGRNVIAVGDYNCEQETLEYKLITQHGQMTDAWQSQNSDTPTNISNQEIALPAFDANAAINQKGITCDSPVNTWSKCSLKQATLNRDAGIRIDYVFYRKTSRFWCSGSRVVFTERIPELGYSYSDHFGVEATFTLVGRDKNSVIPLSIWEQGPYETLHELETRTLKNMIEILDRDLNKSRATSRIQIFLFYACLILILGLIAIEILFSIEQLSTYVWVKVIINVVVVPIAVYGVIMGLVGFLFGNSEQNELKQLIEEIKTYSEGKKILESRESKTSRGSSARFEDNDNSQRSSAAAGINIEFDSPHKL
ncbi:Endonuclease/exonuclease/phosphatase [Gigaspora rosea]|uniref:Endonuclease/exonuclease/phosphatase n=1 Tax=Gigaspora rosea TaxID=44941 RepID=A0A397UQY2_9GLOM|nr:Endonuclease/exonuclease/phosphatase [Gigaspora rosea]